MPLAKWAMLQFLKEGSPADMASGAGVMEWIAAN